jgi:hypothetical protein
MNGYFPPFSRSACNARSYPDRGHGDRQADVLALSTVPDPENYLTYFFKDR